MFFVCHFRHLSSKSPVVKEKTIMARFLGLDKVKAFFDIIKFNDGPVNSFLTFFRTSDLKIGTLVGVDKFGNKYYENDYYFFSRNRWVIYSPRYGYDFDASQVPAEWYGWLHYKTDLPPCRDPSRPNYPWMAEHTENKTGTPEQYVPYSTTRRKIEPWVPPKNKC